MSNRNSFTLIEMLVVIAVIGILMSLLLPSLSKARKRAMLAVSVANMKQLGVAHSIYLFENNDRFITSRLPNQVNIAWDDLMNDMLGLKMTTDEIAGTQPSWRNAFQVLQCPLDEVPRLNQNLYVRSYQLNGYSSAGSPRIFQYGTSPSLFATEIDEPVETIAMNEQAKSHNAIGGGSNVIMSNENLDEVTVNTLLTGGVKYDPNHHQNNFRNPLLFIDSHVAISDMRTTRANNNFFWRSKKP